MAALAVTVGVRVPGDNPLDRLRPAEVAEEMGHAWPQFATACATAGPVLFVVEDLHWASPELLEMLERMLGRCTGPVVLIGTARPELLEANPAYGSRGEGSALISLPPLTEADGQQLLGDLRTGRAAHVPDDLAAEVLARAGGNPFFLEELVAHIADGAPASALPYSLHAVIAARVDALPALERRVLQEASVVGRTFWRSPVEHSLDLADVGRPLLALEARGLILARLTSSLAGQAEYAFKHALVREVAYASLTRARRARAHAAVGSWLEDVAGDRLEELAELLAYHYRQAADPQHAELAWDDPVARERVRRRAFACLLAASSAAQRRFALARAVDLHGAALALASTADEQLQAVEMLGDDHALAYRGEESSRYLHEALDAIRGDPARAADRARLCWKLARQMAMTPGAYRTSPDPVEAEDLVSEGLTAAPDDLSRARLLMTRASCARLWKGSEPFGQGSQFDPTPVEVRIRAVDEAMAIAAAVGDEELTRAGRSTLSVLYGIAGRYAEMLDLAYLDLSTVDQLRSRLEQADVLRMVAVLVGTVAGRFSESLELAQRSLTLCHDSNPHQVMHATSPILARCPRRCRGSCPHARRIDRPAIR